MPHCEMRQETRGAYEDAEAHIVCPCGWEGPWRLIGDRKLRTDAQKHALKIAITPHASGGAVSNAQMTIKVERGGSEFWTIRTSLAERLKTLAADEQIFRTSCYQSSIGAAGRTTVERDEDAAAFKILKDGIDSERATIGALLRKLDAALYAKD